MLPQRKLTRLFAFAAVAVFTVLASVQAATTTLLDLNFNDTNSTYSAYGSPGLTGSPSPSATTLRPTTVNSGLFPTAPTSGYLALTPNASAVTPASFWGGWAANATLGIVNSPYAAGGLGQTNLNKISLTARVRARGMPANGAVVILKLVGNGDNPNSPSTYKRVMFEPIFLTNNDWTTIGGTFDNDSLVNLTSQGTRYQPNTTNSITNAVSYEVLVELSGFNRFGTTGYVAYSNNPTNASSNGRKNPGFDLTAANVRVEVDDVKLFVVDAATNGFATGTTPAQLLKNGNFVAGENYWTFFNGAYVNTTDPWSEDGSAFALIPGWSGSPDAGFMQKQIPFTTNNGDYFTASFRAKFDQNYKSSNTIVAFMDGAGVTEMARVDLAEEISQHLDQWHTYTASFKPTTNQLATLSSNMTLKIQPLGRTVSPNNEFSSALIDNVVLRQTNSSAIGPQIRLRINSAVQTDNGSNKLVSPLIGKTATYTAKIENTGAQDLVISDVTLPGGAFVASGITTPATITPGGSRSFYITASPSSRAPISGVLTIINNDKEVADQSFVVKLGTTPVSLTDSFDGSETAEQLGWIGVPGVNLGDSSGSCSTAGGELVVSANPGGLVYPWSYSASKTFVSPGTIDLSNSSLAVALKASGIFSGLTDNKVQVRLESLNNTLKVTGSIELGESVDETTAGADPGTGNYFAGDEITDRVAVLVPEGASNYTAAGGALSSPSIGVTSNFDTTAPYYRIVVQMTDFDFDDGANFVRLDYANVSIGSKPFAVANGSFELGTYTLPVDPDQLEAYWSGIDVYNWAKEPVQGVSKAVITNGAKIYNQSTRSEDVSAVSTAFAGSKVMKVYGQNYYVGGVWQGPNQKGVVYQEFSAASSPALATGAQIHARGMYKIFAIDPLTGGSTLNYGFKFLNSANQEIGRSITTLSATDQITDRWLPLTVNATIPAGTEKVQLISEFVQNASTDLGAVYLDDLSIGFGTIAPTATVGSDTYSLVWSDEFDGTALNSANWTPETGGGGWGNNEQQTYTNNTENLKIEGGNLIIQAVKSGSSWTSARIKSQGLRSFQYGKIEFRAKLPTGVGPWAAAWMMGDNKDSVGWPACGEIDVMEWRGGFNGIANDDANTVSHALHSASRYGGSPVEPSSRSAVVNPSGAFHTYAVVWTANNLVFSVDGVDKATLTPPTADAAAFQKEFFLILNLAMGGSYVGNTISPSVTSATYEVDYVRVYQATSASSDTTPPVITLAGVNPVTVNWGSTYNDAGASAFDTGDNAHVAVVPSNAVDTSVPGAYLVGYTATDSKGNSANASRTVNVVMANNGNNVGADGFTDSLRYALGGTGTDPLPSALCPSSSITPGTNGTKNLVMTYFARTNDNVSLLPWASANLASSDGWTTSGVVVNVLSNTVVNGTTLQKRQATTPATGSQKFLRLRSIFTP